MSKTLETYTYWLAANGMCLGVGYKGRELRFGKEISPLSAPERSFSSSKRVKTYSMNDKWLESCGNRILIINLILWFLVREPKTDWTDWNGRPQKHQSAARRTRYEYNQWNCCLKTTKIDFVLYKKINNDKTRCEQ